MAGAAGRFSPRGDVYNGGDMTATTTAAAAAAVAAVFAKGTLGRPQQQQQSQPPVSVWRTIFAANEWSQLATSRRASPALTFLLLVYLLVGARLQYLATPQPDRHDLWSGGNSADPTTHPYLRFANSVFWYLAIVLCQRVWVWAIGERFLAEDPCNRFIDSCTLAKVSLLLLDDKYHGFYLHCNAPHEHADGSMCELTEKLGEEAAAVRTGRGLSGCPDPSAQAFEMQLPAHWREAYDVIFRRLLDSETLAVDAALAAGVLPPPSTIQQPQFMFPQQQQQQERSLPGDGVAGGAAGATWQHQQHQQQQYDGVSLGISGSAPTTGISSSRGGPGASLASGGGVGGSAAVRGRERARRLQSAFVSLSSFLRGFIEDTDPAFHR